MRRAPPFVALILATVSLASAADYPLKPVPFNKVEMTSDFWRPRLETQRKTLVPFAFERTQPGVEHLKAARDFLAGKKVEGHRAHRFIDSDLYKVMEGAAYLLQLRRDPELERTLDDLADVIAGAQHENGYLYPSHTIGVGKAKNMMGDTPYKFIVHNPQPEWRDYYLNWLATAYYNLGNLYSANEEQEQTHEEAKRAESAYRQAIEIWEPLVRSHPDRGDFSVALGGAYCNLGNSICQQDLPQAALECYDKAIQHLRTAIGNKRYSAGATSFLRNSHQARARCQEQLDRHADAIRDWDNVLELTTGQNHSLVCLRRATALARIGDYKQALAEVDAVYVTEKDNPGFRHVFLVASGAVLAQASVAAGKDDSLGVDQRTKLAEEYAQEAVKYLERARTAAAFHDPSNVRHLLEDADADFAPLRGRADYEQLLSKIQAE